MLCIVLVSMSGSHGPHTSARKQTTDVHANPSHALGDVRQPLNSEAGPLQGMGHDYIIQEGCVLLPDLVLLLDTLLIGSSASRSDFG